MNVAIIVDSTVDLAPALKERVAAVPLCVRFGQEEYQDGVTITPDKFYELLAGSQELPTTSQPTPAAFEEAYRRALETADQVLCITISSRLSGTYQSATIAAEEFEDKVVVVDSRNAAIGAGILTEYALTLAEQGLSAREILEELMEKRQKLRLCFLVDTLEYLKKGGRLSATAAVVGGLLNIKPLLTLEDGEIKVLGTARGMKKAFAALEETCAGYGGVDTSLPRITGYTGSTGEHLAKFRAEYPQLWDEQIPEAIIGAAIGVHVGPGAVALGFFSKD